MVTELEIPIYISEEVPEDVSPKHLHQDFKMSSQYLLKSGIMTEDTEYGYTYFSKNYINKIITESELIKLVEFWNLELCEPQYYIGDIPYINQLEIHDFFKTLKNREKIGDNPKKLLSIVSTKDLVLNYEETQYKIDKLKERIRDRIYKISELYEEIIRQEWLKNDPIVLYPILNFNVNNMINEKAYMVVTSWGDEEKLVK